MAFEQTVVLCGAVPVFFDLSQVCEAKPNLASQVVVNTRFSVTGTTLVWIPLKSHFLSRKTLSGHAGNIAALHGYELASGQAA